MGLRLQTAIRALALALSVLIGSAAPAAYARDHDAARGAVEAGEARPLNEILKIVEDKLPGEIVRVKFERENGLWVYEFRVVNGQGRLLEVYVDARSGEITRIKEK
jgi:uncharacterized membrane protein YkoI